MPALWMILACQMFSDGGDAQESRETSSAPVVALITIDTWRSDHLSAEHTPNIWRFVERGEHYRRAYSPMGLTTPSHATMLTGLHPWEHGAEANNHHGYSLDSTVPLVLDDFPGFEKAAFVSAYPAGPAGGLRRGWDVFDGPESGERPGTIAVQRALDWLPTHKPAFLWVHVYEPHGPYVGKGSTERARYAEEVRRADAILSPLLDELERRSARIIIASDHGEVLDEERCSYQHERSISDHVLHVPLIRWSPDTVKKTVDDIVSLADVPALLKGEGVRARDFWIAQSGMCESDCAPGCSPKGLPGRDTLILNGDGRWVNRPGRGVFKQGQPSEDMAKRLDSVPPLSEPHSAANKHAEILGYIDP